MFSCRNTTDFFFGRKNRKYKNERTFLIDDYKYEHIRVSAGNRSTCIRSYGTRVFLQKTCSKISFTFQGDRPKE